MSFPVPIPIEKRNQALERAKVVGLAQAARECGVSVRALYTWRDGNPPRRAVRARVAAQQIVELADQLVAPGADRELILVQLEILARRRERRPVGRPRLR